MESLLDKSRRSRKSLEITTVLGCNVKCSYCPQDTLIEAATSRSKKVLKFDKFKQYLDNVPSDVAIHWTGYSEPCLVRDLDQMISYCHDRGHSQLISTTLSGHNASIKFVTQFKYFTSFTLHLPDDQGRMRGLDVNREYLDILKGAIPSLIDNNQNLDLLTFGSHFHPDIEDLISSLNIPSTVIIDRRLHAHSRTNLVDTTDLTSTPVKEETKPKPSTSKAPWFCSYKRLNQPVLIPDGSLQLCCHDYRLSCKVGDLNESNYDSIIEHGKIKNEFLSGTLVPCVYCEYYVQSEY